MRRRRAGSSVSLLSQAIVSLAGPGAVAELQRRTAGRGVPRVEAEAAGGWPKRGWPQAVWPCQPTARPTAEPTIGRDWSNELKVIGAVDLVVRPGRVAERDRRGRTRSRPAGCRCRRSPLALEDLRLLGDRCVRRPVGGVGLRPGLWWPVRPRPEELVPLHERAHVAAVDVVLARRLRAVDLRRVAGDHLPLQVGRPPSSPASRSGRRPTRWARPSGPQLVAGGVRVAERSRRRREASVGVKRANGLLFCQRRVRPHARPRAPGSRRLPRGGSGSSGRGR